MPPGGRRGSILVGAEDFSVGLDVPVPFELAAPELAAAVPPDVAAADSLPEVLDSLVPLAVLAVAAVDPMEPVSTGDADVELEPVISSEPDPDQQTNKWCPSPSSCRLMIIPSMLPIDGGHGQAVESVPKRMAAERRGMSWNVRIAVDAVGQG